MIDSNNRKWFLAVVLALLGVGCAGPAAAAAAPQPARPITKQGLIEALRIGGLTLQELIQYVRDRGVDFQVTPEVEAELRSAAAQRELIEAVRGSFRGGGGGAPAAAPLSKNEILTLLQVGTPGPRVEQLINERGVSFSLTAEIARELQAAGAPQGVLDAAARRGGGPGTSQSAPSPAPPQPPGDPAPAAGPRPTPNVTSLREVKKLFIDKMNNDLDQYIRAEINKELASRFTLVISKDDADAIMTGVGEYRSGTASVITGRYLGLHDNATAAVTIVDRTASLVLWSSEAGDRSLLFGALTRSGPRKLADRLVNNLKKAVEGR